jgi:hypothetical protein
MAEIFCDTGSDVYIKPDPGATPWGSDILLGVEDGTSGRFVFTGLVTNTVYKAYQQLGAEPASSDFYFGDVSEISIAYSELPPDATIPGTASVRFVVLDAGTPLAGARVHVLLEDSNSMVNTALVARLPASGVTNSSGYVDITLIQYAQFTKGGIYRVTVSDAAGRRLHERRVKVPSLASLYAEDLQDA